MTTRHHNDGLTKRCDCPQPRWSKYAHPHRVCLDRLLGRRLKGKTEADGETAAEYRERSALRV